MENTWTGITKNGKKQGFGKLKLKNGTVYEGHFTEDKLNGKGKMVCSLTGD